MNQLANPISQNEVQRYVQAEISAEKFFVSKLAKRLNIGQGFKVASSRSLGSHWSKYVKDQGEAWASMSQISVVVESFVNYMRERKNDIATLSADPSFIEEVTIFVADKIMTYKNYNPHLYLNQDARALGLTIMAFRAIRSLAHESGSKVFKKLQAEFEDRPVNEREAIQLAYTTIMEQLDSKLHESIPLLTNLFGGPHEQLAA